MNPASIIAIILYLGFLVILGLLASRITKATSEDYFMASRTLSKYILIMAILGTQLSAFAIMGLPGEAYHAGFGTLGKYAIVAFSMGFGVYIFGYRAWLVGKKYGYSTSPQLVEGRFNSPTINILVLILSIYYTIPYLLIGIMGGGNVFAVAFGGAIPFWLGALIVAIITVYYVVMGGMRGTAFTNALQGAIFFSGIIIFAFAINWFFGAGNLVSKIAAEQPQLLSRAYKFSPVVFISQALIMSFTPMIFPQVIARVMASRSVRDLKTMSMFYSIGVIVMFSLAILLGVWGAAIVPGLEGARSDSIIPILITKFMGPVLGVFLSIMLLAAISSTLDAQLLSVSHLITLDVVKRYSKIAEGAVLANIGRIAVVIAAALAYIGALTMPGSIVVIAVFAFAGFSLLLWPTFLAFYWRRINKTGFIVGVVVGQILLHLWQFKIIPPIFTSIFGKEIFLPALIISMLLVIIISLVTAQDKNEIIAVNRFFSVFDKAFGLNLVASRTGTISAKQEINP